MAAIMRIINEVYVIYVCVTLTAYVVVIYLFLMIFFWWCD